MSEYLCKVTRGKLANFIFRCFVYSVKTIVGEILNEGNFKNSSFNLNVNYTTGM